MDDGTTSQAVPAPPKRRFQFSLLQLLLAVLSIGGCLTAWRIGWSSFALSIILGWLWWWAYGRGWKGRVALCLLIPAVLCLAGFFHVLFDRRQSPIQHALPSDCWRLQRQIDRQAERQEFAAQDARGEPRSSSYIFTPWYSVGVWGVFLPSVLFAAGLLATRAKRIRNWRVGWATVGEGLGLLVVLVLAGYSVTRAALRRSVLRTNWPPAEFVLYDYASCSNYRSATNSVALYIAKEELGTRRMEGEWNVPKGRGHLQLPLSSQDFEELWGLMEAYGVFYLNSVDPGHFDHSTHNWNLEIATDRGRMCIHSEDYPPEYGLPMLRFRNHFLEWLHGKGYPEITELFWYPTEEQLRADLRGSYHEEL